MISQYTVLLLPTYFGCCGYIIFSAYYTESPPPTPPDWNFVISPSTKYKSLLFLFCGVDMCGSGCFHTCQFCKYTGSAVTDFVSGYFMMLLSFIPGSFNFPSSVKNERLVCTKLLSVYSCGLGTMIGCCKDCIELNKRQDISWVGEHIKFHNHYPVRWIQDQLLRLSMSSGT